MGRRSGKPRQHVHASRGPITPEAPTTLGAEGDLGARAVPLPSAISQPPISQTDGAATCVYMPRATPSRKSRVDTPESGNQKPNLTASRPYGPVPSASASGAVPRDLRPRVDRRVQHPVQQP